MSAAAVGEEEDEDVLLLDSPNFSKKMASKVRTFGSENELLAWLLEDKPPELKLGREHYLELKELEEYVLGLCLKLSIHGYDDRANRLRYLYFMLKKKFENKEHVLKIAIKFLVDMAQRPTAVTHLDVQTQEYSYDLDEDEPSIDDDSERQKALLQEILGDDRELTENLSYSSGDSLSEWSDNDEEEDISARSNNDLPPIIRPVRTSSSFGEFSDIFPVKPEDPETKRKQAELYWRQEKEKAEADLRCMIRRFVAVPLQSQPVISSLLVLQARFGEYWEWKQQQKRHQHQTSSSDLSVQEPSCLEVAFVEDVVREVLWQFVVSKADSSPVFTSNWTVQPNLMVASLSRSTFAGVVNKYGRILSKLEALRKFSIATMSACIDQRNGSPLPPSKVYRMYAAGLQDISLFVIEEIDGMEKELKRLPRPDPDPTGPACTTFVQLEQQTRCISEIIELVYKVHSKSIPLPSPPSPNGAGDRVAEEELPWLLSVKLISSIEAHLLVESRPRLHGVLLFLYSKCLHALLDEILTTLQTLRWDEKYSLFARDTSVRLNDLNFWSDCIKIREFPEMCKAFRGSLYPLQKFLSKVLSILKTCEVFDQLEEDFTQILEGDASKISVEYLIQEFLEETLSPPITNKTDVTSEDTIDYINHFDALGLASSLAAGCFNFVSDPGFLEVTSQKTQAKTQQHNWQCTFKDFLQLAAIPIKNHALVLESVLSKWFDPFCLSAKLRIESIFQDYKLLECMTVFQEIILAVREDFARGIILIAANNPTQSSVSGKNSEYKYEDCLARNSKFQRLLTDCYPSECRGEMFSIDLKLDPTSDMNCTFEVTPMFPLNLIVTPQSVAGYLFIGRQLHRIRKSVWNLSDLSMKTCCGGEKKSITGIADVNRLLIFRFCLINFCSSLRSFFMLKVFSKDFSDYLSSTTVAAASFENDLDSMRRVHENYLDLIQTKMLRHPLIENILIRKMSVMSELLRKHWISGMPQGTMLMLEDTLKKCWQVVNDFDSSTKYSPEFNELSWHFARPPSYLMF